MFGRNDSHRAVRILVGFLAIWLVLDRLASLLGSFTGEFGLLVCASVLVAALAAEWLLFGSPPYEATLALGLGCPERNSLLLSLSLSTALLAFYPIFALAASVPVTLREGWSLFLPGLFAQAGIAEETVFRGYLFRHMRIGRSFWRAAWVSSIPFIAVHFLLFATLDFPLAFASVLLSVAISFPFAYLFELAGGSIWPPAFLHFVVQGSIKLVVVPAEWFLTLGVLWMALAASATWLVFLLPPFDHGPKSSLGRSQLSGNDEPRD